MATFWNLGRRTHFFAQSPQHLTNRRGSQWLPTERQSWRWQLIHSAVEHVAMTWPPPGSFFTMIYNETDQWWSSQWAQYGTGLLIISHKATDLWQTSKQTNKTNSWTNDKASKQSNKQCNGASTFVIVGYCVNHTVWFPFPIPISTPATISSNYFLLLIQIHFFGIFRHTLSSCKEPPMLCRRWPQMSNRS